MSGAPPPSGSDRDDRDLLPGQAAPATPGAAETVEDAIEAQAGRSARGKAASDALRALAHTARSFVLYDAGNERIRGFLQEVRDRVEHFLRTYGELVVEVRPWELAVDGEVVYSEPDRERSLAFRLYRDGVRRLTFHPELDWSELVTLVGIMSIRYKGIRTQEDDIVTLLWRAGFSGIEMAAVEGLVASEEDATRDDTENPRDPFGPQNAAQAAIFAAPYAFDYPWPTFAERAVVELRPLAPGLLERIAREDGPESLPADCLRLARELAAALADRDDPLALADVTATLREVRDYLVGEERFDTLVEVVRAVAAGAAASGARPEPLLAACVDADTLKRFIASIPADVAEAPPALLELASLVPGDLLTPLLDLFEAADGRPAPAVLQLLAVQARGQAPRLLGRLRQASGPVALGLFRLLAQVDGAAAAGAAAELLGRGAADLQLDVVAFCERTPYGPKIGRALVVALESESAAVRARALAVLVRQRERRAFEPLLERLKRGTGSGFAETEAPALGEALARLDPERAMELFREWAKPPGLLGRIVPGQTMFRWAAASGLAALPGPESEELLERLARGASEELRRHAEAALARARRGAGKPHA
ncbi:MAG TPA: hypothetical protein VLW17_15520 [Thermoanaerobaculaceae bacterium]|nr:hypothetical protein [Thermoanaerobaculaceae bacterium]